MTDLNPKSPTARHGLPTPAEVPKPGDTRAPVGRTIVIERSRGWRMIDVQELWAYRDLLRVLVERDIRVRYSQTVLGAGWAVLQPLTTMVIFSVFLGAFAKVPSDGLPYPIFTYSALLPWMLFANSVTASAQSLIGSSNLLTKVYFPRLIIPLAATGAFLLDFLIASSILLLMMLWYGVGLSATMLYAPLMVAGTLLAALAVGTLLSALTAKFRDFRYVVPFMIQCWMFVTPVVYPASLVPDRWQWIYDLNPVAGFVDGFRSAMLNRPVDWSAFGISLAVTLVITALAVAYFERVQRELADVI